MTRRVPWMLVAASVVATTAACYHRRTVQPNDWAALADSTKLTVVTKSGASQEFTEHRFTTTGLVGFRVAPSGVGRDSVVIPLDSIAAVKTSSVSAAQTLLLVAAATTATYVIIGNQKDHYTPPAQPRP